MSATTSPTAYLVVQGIRNFSGEIMASHITAMRKNTPASLEVDQIVVKVRLNLPASLWNVAEVEATVEEQDKPNPDISVIVP